MPLDHHKCGPQRCPIARNSCPALLRRPGALALVAREVLQIEAQAVAALTDRIDGAFSKAVDLLLACAGRVVVSGVGKSGHIARKIAATLASTGTPQYSCMPPRQRTATSE